MGSLPPLDDVPGVAFLRRRFDLHEASSRAAAYVLIAGGLVLRAEVGLDRVEGFGSFFAASRDLLDLLPLDRRLPENRGLRLV